MTLVMARFWAWLGLTHILYNIRKYVRREACELLGLEVCLGLVVVVRGGKVGVCVYIYIYVCVYEGIRSWFVR